MRINDELEKSLLELEEKNNDNVLSLLDVAQALEKTYKHINNCSLKDEKEFIYQTDSYTCKKVKYDSIKGKTIYSVSSPESEEVLFNIEISSIGEINFDVIGQKESEIQTLIEKVNEASDGLLELIKLNADVSFFTENRELVLSSKPYLALKMGNFLEGDKAVLVYKNENSGSDINKTNVGLKYIRVDQIEGYLKNIKLDERRIPILAYAFFNGNNEDRFKTEKFYIMDATYPYLTEEKVERYTEIDYLKHAGEATFACSFIGSLVLGITGGIVGAATVLPGVPLLIAGIGLPALTGTGIFLRKVTNVRRSNQKEELLETAHKKLYMVLKTLANEKSSEIEKAMSFKKKKKIKASTKGNQQELTPREIIVEAKKLLKEIPAYKSNLYLAVINQLENAYGLDNSLKEKEDVLKDETLYGELLQAIEEIYDLPEIQTVDAVDNSMSAMKRLITCGDINKTISNINIYTRAYSGAGSFKEHNTYVTEILNMYLEALLLAKENNETLSVQTVASIPSNTKNRLVATLTDFSERIYALYPSGNEKFEAASKIRYNNQLVEEDEIKIVKAINLVNENNLTYDLLGKNLPKTKVKVKEPTPKVD